MTKNNKKDTRGKSRKEMLEVSKNGTVSISHGGMSFLSRGFAIPNENCKNFPGCGCEKRCQLIDKLALNMETEIMNLPHIEPTDLFLVRQFVKLMTFQEIVDRWLLRKDIIVEEDGKIDMQSIFSKYFILANSLQRLADRLGLNPLARKQLRDKGFTPGDDFAKKMQEIK